MYQHCIDGYKYYKLCFMISNKRAKLYRDAIDRQAAWISDKYLGDLEATVARLSKASIIAFRRSIPLRKYLEENK